MSNSKRLTSLQLAKLLGISHATVLKWLQHGRISPSEKVLVNGRIRYEVPKSFRVKLPYSKEVIKRGVPG